MPNFIRLSTRTYYPVFGTDFSALTGTGPPFGLELGAKNDQCSRLPETPFHLRATCRQLKRRITRRLFIIIRGQDRLHHWCQTQIGSCRTPSVVVEAVLPAGNFCMETQLPELPPESSCKPGLLSPIKRDSHKSATHSLVTRALQPFERSHLIFNTNLFITSIIYTNE